MNTIDISSKLRKCFVALPAFDLIALLSKCNKQSIVSFYVTIAILNTTTTFTSTTAVFVVITNYIDVLVRIISTCCLF